MKSRLRLSEAVTALCVMALAVVAAWPALGIAFGISGTADAATQQSDLLSPNRGLLADFDYREEGSGPGGNPEMFGIPFSGSTLALYCNMSVFMSAGITTGPPTTWSELAADAAKIKADGRIGYGLAMAPGDAAATAQMWMEGDGGRGFSSAPGDRGWSVAMPANVKALSWVADNLVKPGRTETHPETETTQDLEQQFTADKIGMMVADSTLLPLRACRTPDTAPRPRSFRCRGSPGRCRAPSPRSTTSSYRRHIRSTKRRSRGSWTMC